MKIVVTFFLGLILTFCSSEQTTLERVLSDGKLRVVTRNSATTYYEGPNGKTGLEYDLVSRFADELGVAVDFITPENFAEILPMISRGDADFAAAGLTVTGPRKRQVRFTPSYQTITEQLVFRNGAPNPKSLDRLAANSLEVVAGSSHVEHLQALKQTHPTLSWHENTAADSAELLDLVWNQIIDYTIADSNEVSQARRYRPELLVAFDLPDPQHLAWAFPISDDDSLFLAASRFLDRMQASGQLAQLLDRYYGFLDSYDFVSTRTFIKHALGRLPEFQPLFVKAAEQYSLDWHLLAAMGYQESVWRPRARSPTGVRGLMMLTRATAREMGVDNRLDARQSIFGGARYFRRIKNKLPERIAEPDRTWFALAAYNIGFGHLEDARRLTQGNGGDADKWIDVKPSLLLLTQRKYYKKTRHGYARGTEAVRYVENVRRYLDLLIWLNRDDNTGTTRHLETTLIDSPAL